MTTPDPHRLARRPGVAPARAAGENRTGSRPNLAAAGRTPPDRHQDTPEGAGADSGPIPSRTAAAVRASRDPEETTTLHSLAAECSAHALAWDERDDPDGHAATWDALSTLITAAGASVEHLARVRPDLAPVAAEDIAAAYRRLAAHLTVAEGDHHDDR